MMEYKDKIILDKRLKTIYDLVGVCNSVIDVGTDHGKLPALLKLNRRVKEVILVDISYPSLKKAVQLFKDLEITGDFVVSNGFENVIHDFDTLVISGMGTHTIINILRPKLKYLKSNKVRLILAPNTKIEILRQFLSDNSFYIKKEKVVQAAEKFYCIIETIYDENLKNSNDEILLGKFDYNDEDTFQYLNYLKSKIQISIDGISLANKTDLHHLEKLKDTINKINIVLKENYNA